MVIYTVGHTSVVKPFKVKLTTNLPACHDSSMTASICLWMSSLVRQSLSFQTSDPHASDVRSTLSLDYPWRPMAAPTAAFAPGVVPPTADALKPIP